VTNVTLWRVQEIYIHTFGQHMKIDNTSLKKKFFVDICHGEQCKLLRSLCKMTDIFTRFEQFLIILIFSCSSNIKFHSNLSVQWKTCRYIWTDRWIWLKLAFLPTMQTRTKNLCRRWGNFTSVDIGGWRKLGLLNQQNILSHATKSL
jgi:hypothetical protein